LRDDLAWRSASSRKSPAVDKPAFPRLVLVTLLYREVAADGRPADGDEWARLDSTEERIADAMQSRPHPADRCSVEQR